MIVNIHDGPWQCATCLLVYTRRVGRCDTCDGVTIVHCSLKVAWGDDVTAICQGLVAIQGEEKVPGQGPHVITKQSNIGGAMQYEHACPGKPEDNTITWVAHELAWRLHVDGSDLHVLIRHCPYCGVGMHNPDHVGQAAGVLAGGAALGGVPTRPGGCQPDPFPMQQSAALSAILESWPLHPTGDYLSVHIDHVAQNVEKLCEVATRIAVCLAARREQARPRG